MWVVGCGWWGAAAVVMMMIFSDYSCEPPPCYEPAPDVGAREAPVPAGRGELSLRSGPHSPKVPAERPRGKPAQGGDATWRTPVAAGWVLASVGGYMGEIAGFAPSR